MSLQELFTILMAAGPSEANEPGQEARGALSVQIKATCQSCTLLADISELRSGI